MSTHTLITPETCERCKIPDAGYCNVCDGGLCVCSRCGKAEGELSQPCEPRETLGAALREWLRVTPWLKAAREREQQLRLRLVNELFVKQGGELEAGTYRADYVEPSLSVTLKASRAVEYVVLTETLDAALASLPEASRVGLIRVKYELNVREFKALPLEQQQLFHRTLLVKPEPVQLAVASKTEP